MPSGSVRVFEIISQNDTEVEQGHRVVGVNFQSFAKRFC